MGERNCKGEESRVSGMLLSGTKEGVNWRYGGQSNMMGRGHKALPAGVYAKEAEKRSKQRVRQLKGSHCWAQHGWAGSLS